MSRKEKVSVTLNSWQVQEAHSELESRMVFTIEGLGAGRTGKDPKRKLGYQLGDNVLG